MIYSRGMKQVEMNLLAGTRGGWRPGAGRKRDPARHDPAHRVRARHRARYPLHCTLRCVSSVPRLRSGAISQAIRNAMARVHGFTGFRVNHISIQHNHVHLIVEADDDKARSLGMASLAIAVAKAINAAAGRRGAVFAHRYHAVPLATPRQVHHTIGYVLGNWRHHAEDQASPAASSAIFDPYSTATAFDGWSRPLDSSFHFAIPVDKPTAWLLAVGWRRHGLLDPHAVPGPRRAT
jgi:REP element-mobilizing transposase RayT